MRKPSRHSSAFIAAVLLWPGAAGAQTVVTIGIGTQDTTTNTVTAGTIIRELKLLEKHLPKDGKYANIKFEFEWKNFTSGPPVTNGMMANKLQYRHDGRLSAGGERLHLPEQPGKREAA